jgi:gamma-glutamyl hercynylcysteine S-oxide synthase
VIDSTKTIDNVSLFRRLCDARQLTDDLFDIVRTDSLYERPIPERHRLIFYVGHLEAFDWNLLRQQHASLRSPQPAYDQLFAFGIDPVDGGLPTDRPEDWPSLSDVLAYKAGTRSQIDSLLETRQLEDESTLLNVAIEHRLMHAETLAYLFHRMPYEQKHVQAQSIETGGACRPEMISIPAGRVTLGVGRNDGQFGWDNEFDSHHVEVPEFTIDKFMVTSGEYLQFLLAGGYDDQKLWSDADWKWIQAQQIRQPAFWERRNEKWFWRGMFEPIELPLDWPVYVSHAEANAYARWVGKTLPTEAQWHRAAYGSTNANEREYPWGNDAQVQGRGNFDAERWDPSPVNAGAENVSAFGVAGMLGNGWEWASTEFAPFPGFAAFPFYPGYSANFFDGQHFVLKGGSARTAAPLLRRSFRNWFQPHYQYAYTGFRCVSNSENGRVNP